MGQAQPLAGWCWVFSVVHAQMGPCSYIELRVRRCRTHHSDMPRTSGTYRNTWTDGFGCRHTMLPEYHHCQHLKMWIPSKRKKRKKDKTGIREEVKDKNLLFKIGCFFFTKTMLDTIVIETNDKIEETMMQLQSMLEADSCSRYVMYD